MTTDLDGIKPGDTVTLEHENYGRLTGVVHDLGNGMYVPFGIGHLNFDGMDAHGWSITDHKPKVELPTEPGIYIESDNSLRITNIWRLSGSGRWICAAGSEYDDRAEEFAPFARLVPENENRAKIAAEVIDWIATRTQYIPQVSDTLIDEFRKHFGVS